MTGSSRRWDGRLEGGASGRTRVSTHCCLVQRFYRYDARACRGDRWRRLSLRRLAPGRVSARRAAHRASRAARRRDRRAGRVRARDPRRRPAPARRRGAGRADGGGRGAAFVAAATSVLGVAPVVSTTCTEPFHVSSQLASLDHIAAGRAGRVVATSPRPEAAAAWGRPEADPVREALDVLHGRRAPLRGGRTPRGRPAVPNVSRAPRRGRAARSAA
ncbi:LLM class flavin-dependent oxidoreductase [Dactylosporangium sp. CA-139114]|uniref:LLM class flavin-dependent oxidoreductase n=1 Tax=Dactylosporangium sp. CA-139114 TaxID=3239931 RepID=UPI003D977ECD